MPVVKSNTSSQNALREGWGMRRVWWFTATARTRARFVRTTIGGFWLGLSNLFSIAVLGAVYGTVFRVEDFPVYIVYLGLGLSVWNYMSLSINGAPNMFERNRSHILDTNLNPIFFTLEEWAFQLQTFAQSFLLVSVALTWYQHDLILNLLLLGWLPLLNLFLFMYWFPLIVCLLGARFRDLYQLVPVAMQLIFLLSPILYFKKSIGSNLAWITNYNLLYRILSLVRHTIMSGQIPWGMSLFLLVLNLLATMAAIKYLDCERSQIPFLV